ncbi:RNA-directed DNA polymerase, eukaryota [Tanacetum coccineum]
MAIRNRSNEDHTRMISKSIFVTNFPNETTSKDLWKVCQTYGTVVDVYIPNRRTKAGKRFAFVRFIRVDNVDRLVGNLCTLWIGRMHLHANVVRFERSPVHLPRSAQPINPVTPTAPSFVSALKGIPANPLPSLLTPAMVLDDSCLVTRDLENYVTGEILQFSSINNLRVLLSNEGFHNAQIVYLGGFRLCNAQSDFVAKERIVWVDIEGVPLHAWSRSTFYKIGSKWGEVMELETSNDDLFARKRLCIKTKQKGIILESFKIIVKGKIFVVRAKELFVWSPMFKDVPEAVHCSDDESVKGVEEDNVEACNLNNLEAESDSEVVSDTYVGDNADEQGSENESVQSSNAKEVSNDPFNIYDLLNKRNKEVGNSGKDTSIPYPPGFTPEKSTHDNVGQEVQDAEHIQSHGRSEGCSSRILDDAEKLDERFSSENRGNGVKHKEGGSILELLDEMIKVGQTMGFSMEGCSNDMEKIIGSQGVHETKMETISAMDVKFLWGYYNFDHILSESLGNSGGILCTWDPNVFHKEHHIISDNFVALYGTWIPNRMKLLVISVYAPQSVSSKRMLWRYISSLITRWNGESMVMGDFNEVRRMEERWGSTFNAQGASVFNSFIMSSGLIDVQLEGYSFTWAHPSASKMSKLDRFLVTDGLLSFFPHISAVCLDRHLSDHRPILLRELISDFGATPFRLYHSWINLPGFEHMIMNAWNSTVLVDSNGMIRFKKKLQMLKKEIRAWVMDYKTQQSGRVSDLKSKLSYIDKELDQGGVNDDLLLSRMDAMKQLQDVKSSETSDFMQKAKVRWAIEGDENSKFFHGIINRKRANLSVKDLGNSRGRLNFNFPNRLNLEQVSDLESPISRDEIRNAVWGCGCNSSFIALIPKTLDPKLTAFLPNRQILDGPFIINEILSRCKQKNQHAMVFKVDFAKAYDSIRWDYLDDVLKSFGFGSKWCSWIRGSLNSGKTSVLVEAGGSFSPVFVYPYNGVSPFVFTRVIEAGVFTGFRIDSSLMISHLFYADDAVFIGLSINIKKSHLLGVGIPDSIVNAAAESLGCSIMKTPFKYLGVMVDGNMSLVKSWDNTVDKFKQRLSKWKLKTLSIGGMRRNFFNGMQDGERKIAGDLSASHSSAWSSIINEVNALKTQGVDFISHCKIRVGNGLHTSFWNDFWIGDSQLKYLFPRLYALESIKESSVVDKLQAHIASSFSRAVRGGVETQQLNHLLDLLGSVILSNTDDRWVWDLNGDGVFRVKDARNLLDETFLPKDDVPTRWIKCVPIKVNIFAWKVFLDWLPTRSNLSRRGVVIASLSCLNCNVESEDTAHLFFSCGLAKDVTWLVCRWWNMGLQTFNSYSDWLAWFKSVWLGSKIKDVLEGVFYITWWSLRSFRNHLLFAAIKP